MNTFVELILIVVFMIGSAFFSGIETGVISINRIRLKHFLKRKTPGSEILMRFVDNPNKFLGTTLVWNNICNVSCSVLAASLAVRIFGSWGKVLSSVLITILLLVFAEFLPKAWFQSRPIWRCLPFVRLLDISEKIIRAPAAALTRLGDFVVPFASGKNIENEHVSRDEVRAVIDEEATHGVISPEEHKMIVRAIEVSSKHVVMIMRKRSEIAAMNVSMSLDEMLDYAREKNYTRFPFSKKDDGDFDGFVDIASLLILHGRGRNGPDDISAIVQPLQRIPETAFVSEILTRARTTRQRIFIVTDKQKSKVTGLVTVDDVFREIFGEAFPNGNIL